MNLSIHNVVSITRIDREFGAETQFSAFHCTELVVRDKFGMEFEVLLYSSKRLEIEAEQIAEAA